ncbi:MAG: chemotaxis response regulator protein-glutamate methylesterase, partial [Desulfobacterales bacterium]|nr:chemotaxis response regulator protein-glutamate methylesterase [Desulfobacterales bacterium]
TMKALELGAFDFIPKPQGGSMEENKKAVKGILQPMLEAFARQKLMRAALNRMNRTGAAGPKKTARVIRTARPAGARRVAAGIRTGKSRIVGIGVSTGGPNALAKMMPKIPGDIGVPIVIVQHMPPIFTGSLANSLNAKCAIAVKEAVNGEPLRDNTAFIAPGGKQMKIVAGADGKTRNIKITDDPPENSCKPSADYLFRSIAHHYVGRATGVIMTGMGSDGTLGLKLMKRNGSRIIAQDESTCVVYGMPKEPVESGIVDVVAPLDRIAAELTRTVK